MAVGDSLRVKHVAQLDADDVRHVDAELGEYNLVKGWNRDFNVRKMHLSGVRNSDVVCRVCCGTKYVISTGRYDNFINKCPHCHGSGRMHVGDIGWHDSVRRDTT